MALFDRNNLKSDFMVTSHSILFGNGIRKVFNLVKLLEKNLFVGVLLYE